MFFKRVRNIICTIIFSAIGVKLFFSDKEVGCKIVNNSNGLRVSYEPPPAVPQHIIEKPDTKKKLSIIFGPFNAEQVYFPNSDDRNTREILKKIKRGVVIAVRPNGDIYATRLCQARVYFGASAMSPPKLLNRQEETLVYSFQNDFLPMLQSYQNGVSYAAPLCERFFSFGQKWTPNIDPLKELLTRFSVTHFLAKKIFKEIKAKKSLIVEVSNTNSLDNIQKELHQIGLANNLMQPNINHVK